MHWSGQPDQHRSRSDQGSSESGKYGSDQIKDQVEWKIWDQIRSRIKWTLKIWIRSDQGSILFDPWSDLDLLDLRSIVDILILSV